jgi:hypothetical protein
MHAHPLSLHLCTITSNVAVYAPAEWADTLTLFHLKENMYSVVQTTDSLMIAARCTESPMIAAWCTDSLYLQPGACTDSPKLQPCVQTVLYFQPGVQSSPADGDEALWQYEHRDYGQPNL